MLMAVRGGGCSCVIAFTFVCVGRWTHGGGGHLILGTRLQLERPHTGFLFGVQPSSSVPTNVVITTDGACGGGGVRAALAFAIYAGPVVLELVSVHTCLGRGVVVLV